MNDLEQQVTEALRHGGGEEPSAAGLADGIRRRARTRRRNRAAMLAAAAVVVVLAPTAVIVAHGVDGSPRSRGGAASAPSSSILPTMTGPGVLFTVDGCPQHFTHSTDLGRVNLVSVCHYSADGHLTRRGTLGLVASVSAKVAAQEAPAIGGACARPRGAPFVVLTSPHFQATADLSRGCFTLTGDRTAYTLTPELRGYVEKP